MNEEKTQTNTYVKPYKSDKYELFTLWMSLPPMFKNPPADRKTGEKPSPRKFCEMMGIDDEDIITLAEIPTITRFAQVYNLERTNLSDWKKAILAKDPLALSRNWAGPMLRNMITATYNTGIKGNPLSQKLFFQVVGGWNEKNIHEYELGDNLADIMKKELGMKKETEIIEQNNESIVISKTE
jgi:hypothetical protein